MPDNPSPMDDMRQNAEHPCPLCHGAVRHAFDAPSQTRAARHTFGRCTTCGSVIDTGWLTQTDPDAIDTAGYGIESVKFYVEIGATPEAFAAFLNALRISRATPRDPRQSTYLDVGTAFGYSVSLAAFLGYTAIGVEPSLLGRCGRDALGVDIRTAFLDAAGIDAGSINDALCSEVIEHVTDPLAVIRQIHDALGPDGVVLLTTPNADVIVDGSERETADLISAGAHLILFTPSSIEALARRAGFADVRVFASGGDSGRRGLQIVAAKSQGVLAPDLSARWPGAFAASVAGDDGAIDRYLAQLRDRPAAPNAPNVPFSVADGAAYRLVERHVAAGQRAAAWREIDRLLNGYPGRSIADAQLARLDTLTFADYVMAQPAYSSMLFFRAAEHLLQDNAQPDTARRYFEIARRLFEIEARIGVFVRLGWPERALAGRGAAEHALGDQRAARATHRDLARRIDATPDELREPALAAAAGDALRRLQPALAAKRLRALRNWREARGLSGRWRDVIRAALAEG
jgi:SAM-dependent methyltransferase